MMMYVDALDDDDSSDDEEDILAVWKDDVLQEYVRALEQASQVYMEMFSSMLVVY